MLAERSGLRIHEVPVDWVDDPHSSVDIVATALADLKGIARLGRALASGRLPLHELRRQFGRDPRPDPVAGVPAGMLGQLARFAVIGVASTAGLPAALPRCCAAELGAFGANLIALVVTAVANTAANRRLTFGVRGRAGAATHQLQGLLVFGLGLAFTTGALAALAPGCPTPARASRSWPWSRRTRWPPCCASSPSGPGSSASDHDHPGDLRVTATLTPTAPRPAPGPPTPPARGPAPS